MVTNTIWITFAGPKVWVNLKTVLLKDLTDIRKGQCCRNGICSSTTKVISDSYSFSLLQTRVEEVSILPPPALFIASSPKCDHHQKPPQWWIQGRSLRGPPPPYFYTKLRPEKLKEILETPPPSPRLSQGLDPALLPVVTAFYKTGSLGI